MKSCTSRWCVALIAAGVLTVSGEVLAAPISGTLNLGGSAAITLNTATGSAGVDVLPAGGGAGAMTVDMYTQTGNFVSLGGTSGLMADLNNAMEPVGTPFSLSNFLTFSANPDITFTLTSLSPGVFGSAELALPPAPGQTATPPGSMLNLTNTQNGSTLSFDMAGTVRRNSTGEMSTFKGTLTTQFGDFYQTLLADWSTGGAVPSSFSATFRVTPVPEPASLGVLGASGLLLLRRRRRASV